MTAQNPSLRWKAGLAEPLIGAIALQQEAQLNLEHKAKKLQQLTQQTTKQASKKAVCRQVERLKSAAADNLGSLTKGF